MLSVTMTAEGFDRIVAARTSAQYSGAAVHGVVHYRSANRAIRTGIGSAKLLQRPESSSLKIPDTLWAQQQPVVHDRHLPSRRFSSWLVRQYTAQVRMCHFTCSSHVKCELGAERYGSRAQEIMPFSPNAPNKAIPLELPAAARAILGSLGQDL